MGRIRKQRTFMKETRDKEIITKEVYRNLYMKAKGGFFRSIRHLKMYMNEHALFTKKDREQK